MASSRIQQSVRNNALWCDALSRVRGAPEEFYDAVWLIGFPNPHFYPTVITLSDRRDVAPQLPRPQALTALNLPGDWSVKDRF